MGKHYHLIGIGGIGMSCIAQLLLRRGHVVSGSDIKESSITQELVKLGAQIFIGHGARCLGDADIVIYSSAIKEDNPEIREAVRKNLVVFKRAQALADLMHDKRVITVAGSHGKTTTTSLVSYLLLSAGLQPSVAIGGISRNIDTNACLGSGDYFIAEADESDGTFLSYQPDYSIITNIDYEHMDYYKDFQSQLDAFAQFMRKTKPGGCVYCCGDDTQVRSLALEYRHRCVLFGMSDAYDVFPANIQMEELSSHFDCYAHKQFVAAFDLALGGLHNISNALAVIALGLELGIGIASIQSSLAAFKGVRRRLEVKYNNDYLLIDDYAHHPTEIKATLSALTPLKRRIIAVFQPHRYTRTKLLLDEFGRCFDMADYVIITDIYPASEPPLEGVQGSLICDKIKEFSPAKKVSFMPKEEIARRMQEHLLPGDVVITLGAGDIFKVCDELVEQLSRKSTERRAT